MLDDFYTAVKTVSRATTDLSEESKAVVLIRLAIEESAREVGVASALQIISKLMTSALGILAENEDNPLDDFNVDSLTPN